MKATLNVTIDEVLFRKLENYCKKNFINKSALVESWVDEFLTKGRID